MVKFGDTCNSIYILIIIIILNFILETETPGPEGSQGDKSDNEHASGGVSQQNIH